MSGMVEKVRRAVEKRRSVWGSGGAGVWRAVSGEFDGVGGVFVDVYQGEDGVGGAAGGAVMNVYEGRTERGFESGEMAGAVMEVLGEVGVRAGGVYVKRFVRDRSRLGGELPEGAMEGDPVVGGGAGVRVGGEEGGKLVVREGGVGGGYGLEVRLWDGLSTGVFVDQRENRGWVRGEVGRRVARGDRVRVLNTFAYTCAFSVAAGVAGAEVTSVDVSGRYLEWGRRNFALNGIEVGGGDKGDGSGGGAIGGTGGAGGGHRFAKMDTFEFFGYARRKGLRYDVVILDPPSFGSGNKKKGIRAWSAVEGYARLVGEAVGLVERGGRVLCSTNNGELCQAGRLEREVVKGLGGKPRWVRLPEVGVDVRGERGRFAAVGFEVG